jgi:Poly(hydroxyalcanoate) granule associated protein (phasin)
MLKQSTTRLQPNQITEAVYVASRQVWLAGLGAAAVGRDWAQHRSAPFFKSLVEQGTAVESRAIRFVGDQLETSMIRANAVWKHTRRTVESNVKQVTDTAVTLAQQVLPKLELSRVTARTKRPAGTLTRAKNTTRARAGKSIKKTNPAKRTLKAAKKRA